MKILQNPCGIQWWWLDLPIYLRIWSKYINGKEQDNLWSPCVCVATLFQFWMQPSPASEIDSMAERTWGVHCKKLYLVNSSSWKNSRKTIRIIFAGLLRFQILHLKIDLVALVNYRTTSLRMWRTWQRVQRSHLLPFLCHWHLNNKKGWWPKQLGIKRIKSSRDSVIGFFAGKHLWR